MCEPLQKFSILHLNIRSLRENFVSFIAQLSTLDRYPDVIILSEIWIYDNEIHFYSIPDFVCHFNCDNARRSGGVAIDVRKRFNVTFSNIDSASFDAISCSIRMPVNKDVYKILGIYRSPNNVSSFYNELNDYLESNISSDMLLIGDINLDIHKNCVQGEYNRTYLDMLSRFCFLQFSDGYTRISSNSLGRISKT